MVTMLWNNLTKLCLFKLMENVRLLVEGTITRKLRLATAPPMASFDDVPTHVVTLTQVGTGVYLGQTHLGTPFQVPAWVRKFSLGSTGDEISSLIIFKAYLYSRISSIK